MGRKDVRSSHCGQCGSSDIDVETDLTSMRLEALRLEGDPELKAKVLAEIARQDAEKAKRP